MIIEKYIGRSLTILFALGAVGLCVLAACAKPPLASEQSNNPNIVVELLFEHDGIKIYRFYDNSRPIYYTDARGATQWDETHSSGKNSYTVRKTVPTER